MRGNNYDLKNSIISYKYYSNVMIKSKYLENHEVKIHTGSRDLDSAILERKSTHQKWDDIVISAGFSCFHLLSISLFLFIRRRIGFVPMACVRFPKGV